MTNIYLFVEDNGHEQFIKAVLNRLASEFRLQLTIKSSNVRGGHGKAVSELREFIRDLQKDKENIPDLIIVAIDCNCKKYSDLLKQIKIETQIYSHFTIYALPDPHVERWLLLDSSAFKSVFGKGCRTPDYKCERDRYKNLLYSAVDEAGFSVYFGGLEWTEEIVNAMNLHEMEQNDTSLGNFLKELKKKVDEWKLKQ